MVKEKTVYRVRGFTCANCAKTFETNVKNLQGVKDAEVNFGASKITVYGEASIQELEKAGAFENLKIYPENEKLEEQKEPFWKRYRVTILSAIFLFIGWGCSFLFGDHSLLTVFSFLISILIGGWGLFKTGFKNLFHLQFDMKTLMTIAIIGAAIIGEWKEGATVVMLFAISEALEAYSMDRARNSIKSLMDIAPKEALVFRGNKEKSVKVEDIRVDDILIVKPGEKIAMDGVIINGSSFVNQSAITGESIPVMKTAGDEVFAGTLNEDGLVKVKVTKTVEDTTLAKIIHLVEEAQGERAPSQAFIDKFAKYYTPVIMLIALLVATIPPLLFDADWKTWIYQGLAVLVVGCPCALVISTPVAVVTAIGNAARNGVLIKGGIHLEQTGKLQAIAFDKTGTLTNGTPVVTDVDSVSEAFEDGFAILAAIENQSHHPLAKAVVQYAQDQNISYSHLDVADLTSITGKGMKATVNGETYVVGSPNFIEEEIGERLPKTWKQSIMEKQAHGNTVVLLANKKKVLLIVAISDKPRKNSRHVIEQLNRLGIKKIWMLTGDNENTANAIAKQIGVPHVKAELLPEGKVENIKKLRNKYEKVAMIGDGVNDAPALAAATVGIAMGASGTDTALETADIALMGDDLKKIPFMIRLSRKALAVIKQNVAFSIGIKLLALLLVVPGWLTLWLAIFADMGATLLVTLNALRLLRVKEELERYTVILPS